MTDTIENVTQLASLPTLSVSEPISAPKTTYEDALDALRAGPTPSILIFDCDWTLYPFDCDKDRIGPFSWQIWHGVVDYYGRPSNSYTDVSNIFGAIIDSGISVAFLSRNPSAHHVKQLLSVIPCNTKVERTKKFLLNAMPSDSYFHAYSSNGFGKGKDKHFRALRADSSIPFSEMLFFDDMPENVSAAEVQGTTSVLLGRMGLTLEAFTGGLQRWRQRSAPVTSAGST